MKLPIVPFSLACLLFCAGGCAPKSPTTPPATVAPPVNAPAAPVPAPVPTVAPVVATPQAPTPVPVVVRPFDESLLRGREFLLETSSAPQFVRDPDLGPLGTDLAVTKAVEAFFRDAHTGKLDSGTLVPRWAAYLQGWARRYQKSEDGEGKTVRVGTGVPGDQGLLMVPVRVNGGKTPLQGWLALVRDGETWLVSDVQVVETAPRTGPYDPESPPQEISSPSLR